MKLAKVIGRVVSTEKLSFLEGKTLLVLQPIEPDGSPAGKPLVALDTVKAGEGDRVYFEGGKEAAGTVPPGFNPLDAAIIAVVDDLHWKENS